MFVFNDLLKQGQHKVFLKPNVIDYTKKMKKWLQLTVSIGYGTSYTS